MAPERRTRVLVVDDETPILDLVRGYLEREGSRWRRPRTDRPASPRPEPGTAACSWSATSPTSAMGGHAWAESRGPGTGATFLLELPAA